MTRARRHRRFALLVSFALALPLAAQKAPPPAKNPPPTERNVPFRAGEELEFRASWEDFLTAAVLTLRAPVRGQHAGRPAWNFQATAQTIAPVRFLYPLDDRFDAWADTAALASRLFIAQRDEPNKQERRTVRFAYEGEPAPDGGAVRVSRDTRDPITALFYLRTLDWPRVQEANFKVYDGEKLYAVEARLEAARDSAETSAGTFAAMRLALRVLEKEKERTDVRIRLWLAADQARTPVLIEAALPFGRVRVALSRRAGA
jgi:hypothetical protein